VRFVRCFCEIGCANVVFLRGNRGEIVVKRVVEDVIF